MPGWRGSTGRSAGGCCSGPAGGPRRSPPAPSAGWPNPWHLVLFLVGAIAMRGAGCTYNDIVDRDIDAAVARTRSRPIPSGQVSVRQAKIFLRRPGAGRAASSSLQFNRFTILLGIASLAHRRDLSVHEAGHRLAAARPRPRVLLGRADGLGGGLRQPRSARRCSSIVGAILWTIGYDTIYAHQDKEDDALVGVRSTARLFGARTKPLLALFYAGATVLFARGFFAAGVGAGRLRWAWRLGAVAARAGRCATLDIDDPDIASAVPLEPRLRLDPVRRPGRSTPRSISAPADFSRAR